MLTALFLLACLLGILTAAANFYIETYTDRLDDLTWGAFPTPAERALFVVLAPGFLVYAFVAYPSHGYTLAERWSAFLLALAVITR